MAESEQRPRPVLFRFIVTRLIRHGLWGWFGSLLSAAHGRDAETVCANPSTPRSAT